MTSHQRRLRRLFAKQHKLAKEAIDMQIGQCQNDEGRDYWENELRKLKEEAKELRGQLDRLRPDESGDSY